MCDDVSKEGNLSLENIERSGNMGCVGRGEGGGGGGKGGGDDTISFVLVCWLFFSSRFEKIKEEIFLNSDAFVVVLQCRPVVLRQLHATRS